MKRSTATSLLGCFAITLAACGDSPTPTAISASPRALPGTPSATVGVGFTTTADVRTNLGPFNVHSQLNGFDVELKSHENDDIEVANQAGAPNANGGWHLHPGPVVVLVKTGVATIYEAGDCVPKIYPAGSTFIEGTTPHVLRNDGASNLEIVAVFFVPNGKPRRIEADQPANCLF
jgi:quercetin dioxygenase-like cupin family protein